MWESYYSARLFPGFFAAIDVQHVANPAYNQARGPVWIYSLRLHLELGLHKNGTSYARRICPRLNLSARNAPLTAEFIIFSANLSVA